MEPLDLSLIEIGGSDDSLIEQDLNIKSIRRDDLLNVVDAAGANHNFECSPLQTLGFKRSSARRPAPAIETSNVDADDAVSGSVEGVVDKENVDEKKDLSAENSKKQMKMRRKVKGYNLRKSLAWNSAFFTEEGVLDSTELSTLCDKSIRESKKKTSTLSSISEETSAPLPKSGDTSLRKPSNEVRRFAGALSRKAGTASQKSAASTPSKAQTGKGARIGSNGRGCPRPPASSSQKKPLNSNSSSAPVVNSRLAKPPLPKSEPSSVSSNKYAGTGARGLSSNLNIPSGSVQKNVVLKGRNSTKVASGIASSSSSKSMLLRSGKNLGKSFLPAPVPTNSKLSQGKRNDAAGKKVLNPALPGDKPAPRNVTGSSSIVEPTASNNNERGRNIQTAQIQVAKPTGLRMPSPSLGFFDQKKASASPGILSPRPRGAHSSNLGEHDNPTFQKLNTPSRNSETKRVTAGTMRLPREGTDSTKHRVVTSKDRILSNITSPSNVVMKLNLEPNSLLTKLRSDFNPSANDQTHTQQGSQVISENFAGLDEKQMEVSNPTWDELDHISKDEDKVLAQSGSSPQDHYNSHLETSEVTDLQGSSSTRNESDFLRVECQVNSEMPLKRVDSLLGHKEYTVMESISADNHDGISSTDFKDDAGVKDALVVHFGFSEIGLNGNRQSAGAETREFSLHDVNEAKHLQKVSNAPSQMNSQMHASEEGILMESDRGIGIQTGILICNLVGNEDVVAAHLMSAINQAGLKTLVPGDHCCRVSCDTDGESEQQAELRNPQNGSEKVLFEHSPGNLIITQEDREAKGRSLQDSDAIALLDPVVQLKESYSGGHRGMDTQIEALHSLHDHLSYENHDINFGKKHTDEKISSSAPTDSFGVVKAVGEPDEKQLEHIETSSDEVVQIFSKCDPELLRHDMILLNEGIYSEQYTHEDNSNLSFIQSSTPELPKDDSFDNATNDMEFYEEESTLRPIKDQIASDNRSEEDHMLTKIVGSDISPSCKNLKGSSKEGNCSKSIHKRKSMDGLMPDARAMKPKLNDLPCDELLAAHEEAEGEKRASASPTIRSPRGTDSCSLVEGIDSTKYGDVASGLTSKCSTPSITTSLSHLVTDSNLGPSNLLIKLKSDSNPSTSDDQTFIQQDSEVIQDNSVGSDEKQMEVRSPNRDGFDHMSHDEKRLAEKNSVQRRPLQDQSNTHLETSADVHSQGISSDQTESKFLHTETECQVNSETQVERVDNSIESRNGEDTVIDSLSVDNHDSILEISQDCDRQSGQAESREGALHDVNETKDEHEVSHALSQMSSEMHSSKAGKESRVDIGFLTCNVVGNNNVVSELHFSEAVNRVGSEVLASHGNYSRGSCDTDGASEQQAELGYPSNESEVVLFEDVHEEQNENVSVKQKGPIDESWEKRGFRNLVRTQENKDANGRLMQGSDVSALSSPALHLEGSDRGEYIKMEDNQMEALQFNSFDMLDEKLNSSVPNAGLGVLVNTSSVEVEQILFTCNHELQNHDEMMVNDDTYSEPSQEDNVGIKSSTCEQLPEDHSLENATNSSSERRVFSAAGEDDSFMHSHTVNMCLNSSSNNQPIENHETTKDELFEHLFSERYEAESSFISRSDQTVADNGSEENYTSSKIIGSDLSPSSKSSNSGSPMRGNCSKSINKRKSLDDVKPDGRAMKPKLNAVPFSEEWLAALEAAGEDILTMKSGAVQNSPPEKSTSEPNPWSPVKRKNSEEIGPFHCTKYTTLLQPPQ